jgi:hypothetical protein
MYKLLHIGNIHTFIYIYTITSLCCDCLPTDGYAYHTPQPNDSRPLRREACEKRRKGLPLCPHRGCPRFSTADDHTNPVEYQLPTHTHRRQAVRETDRPQSIPNTHSFVSTQPKDVANRRPSYTPAGCEYLPFAYDATWSDLGLYSFLQSYYPKRAPIPRLESWDCNRHSRRLRQM